MSTRAAIAPTLRISEKIRNLSPKQKIYLALSGGVGGILACLADLIQKEHASAVLQIDQMFINVLQVPSRPILVVSMLVAFGVALCFIFATDTNTKAFYIGASILAVIMAMVPYKAPPNLDTSPAQPPTVAPTGWLQEHLSLPVVYAQIQEQRLAQFRVNVHLSTSDRKPVADAFYILMDPATGQVIARSKAQGNDYAFYVTSRDYLLRVEVPGYAAAQRKLSVRSAETLTIMLSPTKVPLAVQRVINPY